MGASCTYWLLNGKLSNSGTRLEQVRVDLQSARTEQRKLTEQIKQLRIDYSGTIDLERILLTRETEHIKRIRDLQAEIQSYRATINSSSGLIGEGKSIVNKVRKGN